MGCNSCSSVPYHCFNNVQQGEREGMKRGGVEDREVDWRVGGTGGCGRRGRDASCQNISMQSSYWCSKDCGCLSTAAAAFQVGTAMSHTNVRTPTCTHAHTRGGVLQ